MSDWDTYRFESAQNLVYSTVLDELHKAKKLTHWMWFIFPQLRALGKSQRSLFYGIPSLSEAIIYINHPLLGKRLIECADIMLSHSNKSAQNILGSVDAVKFKSSMTLFHFAAPNLPVFTKCIDKYFSGELDMATEKFFTYNI